MKSNLRSFLLTMLIAACGGGLFHVLHMPLPWTLGALAAVAFSTIRFTPHVPNPLRNGMSACIGIMLGSGFSPATLSRLDDLALSFAVLLSFTFIGAIGGVWLARRLTRYDAPTTYFMAMPGGLNDMAQIGFQMGADSRAVAINHSLRILITVWTMPIVLPLLTGLSFSSATPSLHSAWPGPLEFLLLGFCVSGWPLARLLKLPAAQIMGPMLLSSALHMSEVVTSAPPRELVIAAQVVMGAWLGGRFLGTRLSELRHMVRIAGILTAYLLVVALMATAVSHQLTGLPWPVLLLAYAPGGLSEMSLTALALHMDGSLVAIHHLVRVMAVLLAAPFIFKYGLKPR